MSVPNNTILSVLEGRTEKYCPRSQAKTERLIGKKNF